MQIEPEATVMTIVIKSSSYGRPQYIVASKEGQIVWVGHINEIERAPTCDTLHCNDDDLEHITALLQQAGIAVCEA